MWKILFWRLNKLDMTEVSRHSQKGDTHEISSICITEYKETAKMFLNMNSW